MAQSDIRRRLVVGIAGGTGSGKSTLASLIPHLYEVEDGQIFIGGDDINRIPLAALRRSIAVVPQESFLFSMSLAQNIAFGVPNAEPQAVLSAAAGAQLDKDVDELPNGYDTVVGERGAQLSGGQRQRIAIARALLRDPPILVLDEATSALDSESERVIQDAIERLLEGRTVLVIAHRLSTVQRADQILVMESGRICERGTHAELLSESGAYRRLYELQLEDHSAARGP